ncbi:HNH endonuclease [Agromyces atrinae]|uniref:HNH endonuclease signature motif containing protein n=1 Tax=Agromyces atrinae TaxID=592376 RepID=UPI001F57FC40|nr:HNH endonuclease signature motif containing protein [Agromyces atrinae]MCI2957553.1 HNH endonuclease [Agromyces atrinae]
MSTTPEAVDPLLDACGSVADAWAGALIGGVRVNSDPWGSSEWDASDDVMSMSAAGLLRVQRSLAHLSRQLDALQVRVAHGIAERSTGDDDDLARSEGYSSATRLIAASLGTGFGAASRIVSVGVATAPRQSFTGERLPARHPILAAALADGRMTLAVAALISTFLDRIALRASTDELNDAEGFLVERARHVGPDGITRLIKRLEAHLDPDGVEPREDALRAARSLTIREDRNGLIRLTGTFDPENGAPIQTAINALVGAALHESRGEHRPMTGIDDGGIAAPLGAGDDGDTDPTTRETRSLGQIRADALTAIAQLSLASTDAPPALRAATVVARIDYADLIDSLDSLAPEAASSTPIDKRGSGYATIDGISTPVSAATARRMAASHGVIPLVLGGDSEVLDLGRDRRLFTPAQRIALTERDGGCAWPDCGMPPSHTQAHHIRWWTRDNGPTDLSNGIMLCSFHHHRVHADGWKIHIDDSQTWFTPPVHLDPSRTPRRGGSGLTRAPSTRRRSAAPGKPAAPGNPATQPPPPVHATVSAAARAPARADARRRARNDRAHVMATT